MAREHSSGITFPRLYSFFLTTVEDKPRYFFLYFFALLHPLSNPLSSVFASMAVSFLAAGHFHDLTPFWWFIGGTAVMDLISIFVLKTYVPLIHETYHYCYNNTIYKALAHIKTLGLDWYSTINGGELIHKVSRGADAIKRIMINSMDVLVHESLRCLVAIAFTIYFLHDVTFVVGVAVYMVLSLMVINLHRSEIHKRYQEYKDLEKNAFTNIYNFAAGFSTIKLANLTEFFLGRTMEGLKGGPGLLKRTHMASTTRQMMLRLLRFALYIGLFVYVGNLIFAGKAQVGVLILVFSMLQNLDVWAQNFATVENVYLEEKTYFQSLFDVLSLKPTLADRAGALPLQSGWDKINFSNISFKYQAYQNFKAIDGLSLEITRGSKVAFVGESGSGKSTLAKLLLRQYPFAGNIKIGAQNIFDLQASSIYDAIGYLPQDVEIFDLTFKENITLGLSENSFAFCMDEIVKAAHLQDILDRLPQGMDTLVGARGIRLSGGERQRLGLARFLCQKHEIYIFDECTSQLDSITEDRIIKSIFTLLKDKTIILIAHRLYTLTQANSIIVLENGRIVEQGSFPELVAMGGIYARLLKLQNGEIKAS